MPTVRGLHNAGVTLGKKGGKISAEKRSSKNKKAMAIKKKAAPKKAATKKKAAPKKKAVAKKKAAPKKTAAKKNNAGTKKLKQITTRAKAIYKGGKNGMKWTSAIKKAAKELKK